MQTSDGHLTQEAIELLNAIGRADPLEMYPLTQLAADMGRAGLITVKKLEDPDNPVRRRCPWGLYMARLGEGYVTDPELVTKYRCREAVRKLTSDNPWPDRRPS